MSTDSSLPDADSADCADCIKTNRDDPSLSQRAITLDNGDQVVLLCCTTHGVYEVAGMDGSVARPDDHACRRSLTTFSCQVPGTNDELEVTGCTTCGFYALE